jgi:dihydroorotate dehydrogenase (fumarate)
MIDLKTKYLGLTLKHPLMPGASPLVDDLDQVRKLEDAGASAIVMHSLFEEQILAEQASASKMDAHSDSFGEALSYLPNPAEFKLGPEKYLEQIRKIKEIVSVPVIASLNGISTGGWTRYAGLMQEAGADAVELNVYFVATDPRKTGGMIEAEILELVKSVKQSVKIPVAVKLSPFFTSLPNFAAKLDQIPVDGIVLYNRFYQPDIDVTGLKIVRSLQLSTSNELLLRLHGLALLSGHTKASLAVSGGVHNGLDAIKALMSGACAVQCVSTLLLHGPRKLQMIAEEIVHWMEENEYSSVEQMVGNMSLAKSPDPGAFERLNYMEVLKSWR